MHIGDGLGLALWAVVGLVPLLMAMVWLVAVRLWGGSRRPVLVRAWFKQGPQAIGRGSGAASRPPSGHGLAGLACDATLDAAMAHAWRRFGQWQRPVALLEISIDGLAQLREQVGERQADAVVGRLSWQLKRALRAGDVLAHAGDGVFRVLLPDTAVAPAQALAWRLLQTVGADAGFQPTADQRLRLSAGLAHALEGDRSASALGLRASAQRLGMQRARGTTLLVDALASAP